MKKNSSSPSRSLLLTLVSICVILMLLTTMRPNSRSPFAAIAGVTVVPLQQGFTRLGTFLYDIDNNLATMQELRNDNDLLRAQVTELMTDNAMLQEDRVELVRLQNLLRLDQEYASYETMAARVIGMEGGNWFQSFVINKGSNQGIRIDMNVLAGHGLVGIVSEVGPNWARVRSIVDDTSNVSGMILSTSDRLIVRGDLALLNEGRLRFEQLDNNEHVISIGDQVVTSYISDLFLQGILIGTIGEIAVDANNLTRSGTIIPAADFQNIQEVLVIMQTKADLMKEE